MAKVCNGKFRLVRKRSEMVHKHMRVLWATADRRGTGLGLGYDIESGSEEDDKKTSGATSRKRPSASPPRNAVKLPSPVKRVRTAAEAAQRFKTRLAEQRSGP